MKSLPLLLATALAVIEIAAGQATFQLDKTSYQTGESIAASWTGSSSGTDWIGIYPRGIVPDGDPVSTTWSYVSGASGSLSFNTPDPVGVGEWTAWFLANDGYGTVAGTSPVDFEVLGIDPEITNFTTSSNFAPASLSWTIARPDLVTSLTLDDGVNPPIDVLGQSEIGITPEATRVYTLTLNGGLDTADQLVMVATENSAAFSVDKTLYTAGETTEVTWTGATANPDSWIGIYAADNTPDTENSDEWNYLNGTQTPGGSVPDGELFFNLPAGDYFAVLFVDEGYTIEQGPVLFSVVEPVEEIIPVVSVTRSGGTVTIEWESEAGVEYDVHASATLEGDPVLDWDRIRFALPSEGDGTTSFSETLPEPAPLRRFYKIYSYESTFAE